MSLKKKKPFGLLVGLIFSFTLNCGGGVRKGNKRPKLKPMYTKIQIKKFMQFPSNTLISHFSIQHLLSLNICFKALLNRSSDEAPSSAPWLFNLPVCINAR